MKFPKEQARLRAILATKDCQIWFGRHAEEEMAKDQITSADVNRVLTLGHVAWFEVKRDEIVHVEGVDVDKRKIRVIVGLRDCLSILRIITVMLL